MAVAWRQNSNFYQKYLLHMLSLYKNRADVKIYLELLLSMATIVIFIIFAIKPTLTTIGKLSAEISVKQEIVTALDQKISALTTAQQLVEQNKDKIAILDQSIPHSPEVASYIKQIEVLANNHALSIDTIQLSNVSLVGTSTASNLSSDQSPLTAFPQNAIPIDTTFGVSGQYSDLSAFLKDLEDLRRPIAIDSITANSIIQQDLAATIQFTIKGRLPYVYE